MRAIVRPRQWWPFHRSVYGWNRAVGAVGAFGDQEPMARHIAAARKAIEMQDRQGASPDKVAAAVERLFAFRILHRLHNAQPQTFRSIASARFFGVERLALHNQAMERRGLLRFRGDLSGCNGRSDLGRQRVGCRLERQDRNRRDHRHHDPRADRHAFRRLFVEERDIAQQRARQVSTARGRR